jgi:hypothetical protein
LPPESNPYKTRVLEEAKKYFSQTVFQKVPKIGLSGYFSAEAADSTYKILYKLIFSVYNQMFRA